MLKTIRNAAVLFLLLGIVCGAGYPLLVTVIAQHFFPFEANGSLVVRDGKPVGSELIAQNWTEPRYFQGRPSASHGGPDNAMMSGGTNDGPTGPWLVKNVRERIESERKLNPKEKGPVPQDLATASGSGLDPDITPEAALWQAGRVALARGVPRAEIESLIHRMTKKPLLHFLGVKRVNVLAINLELDRLYPVKQQKKEVRKAPRR